MIKKLKQTEKDFEVKKLKPKKSYHKDLTKKERDELDKSLGGTYVHPNLSGNQYSSNLSTQKYNKAVRLIEELQEIFQYSKPAKRCLSELISILFSYKEDK